jgi:uncharacterized protein with HEPN domain
VKPFMPRDYKVYLDDILLAISRIREYTAGLSSSEFAGDVKTVDAVVRNLEVIGEAVNLTFAVPQICEGKLTSLSV